jgi:general secretion pathway protein I
VIRKYRKSHPGSHGFTLLEVLVALVIVSLGMIAVFGQLNQMLNVSSRLVDKTLAHWIAVDQITELQAIHAYPKVGERRDEVDMARATWSYTVKTSQIGDLAMRRVDVTVAFADAPEQVLAEVSGFIAPPQQAVTAGPSQQGGGGGAPQGGSAQEGGDVANPTGTPGATNPTVGTGFGDGWDPLDPNAYGSGEPR